MRGTNKDEQDEMKATLFGWPFVDSLRRRTRVLFGPIFRDRCSLNHFRSPKRRTAVQD